MYDIYLTRQIYIHLYISIIFQYRNQNCTGKASRIEKKSFLCQPLILFFLHSIYMYLLNYVSSTKPEDFIMQQLATNVG